MANPVRLMKNIAWSPNGALSSRLCALGAMPFQMISGEMPKQGICSSGLRTRTRPNLRRLITWYGWPGGSCVSVVHSWYCRDQSGQIQLYINRSDLDEATLEEIKSWDIGDIVGAQGPVHRSGKGDLYVNMHQARLLTKSLRPLPDQIPRPCGYRDTLSPALRRPDNE